MVLKALLSFLTFSVSSSLWADSVDLSWDLNTDATGYRVYVGLSSGTYNYHFDAGNVSDYRLGKLTPGLPYFVAITAYNDWDESDYSNEVKYIPPLPKTSLQIDPNNLSLNMFAGGFFMLEQTSDFKNWNSIRWVLATSDFQMIPRAQLTPGFFRLKYVSSFFITPPQGMNLSPLETQIRHITTPPLPEVLPAPKLTLWKKLKLALRYQPGKHPKTEKGAEDLIKRR